MNRSRTESISNTGGQPVELDPGQPDLGQTALHSTQWMHALALIESIVETTDQQAAVTALVGTIAEVFPEASIRCGIGTAKLKKLYDRKLGWLGESSELFRDAARDWNDEDAKVSTRSASEDTTSPYQLEKTETAAPKSMLRLNIDDSVGLGRCVLWIDGQVIHPADRLWLRRALPTLRAVLWQRTGGVFSSLTRPIIKSGMTAKVYLGLATLTLLLLSIWPVSYRVRCSAVVRPLESRVVAIPFEATLSEALVEPGDSVKAGDVLMILDGRPLRLELDAIDAQIAQAAKKADVAAYGGKVAEAQQARMHARELSRRRDLLTDRLSKLRVTSPIDGIVVNGDLKRSIGAPMETGQAVFEIAPLSKMAIELEIPEFDIGYVSDESVSRIRLTASQAGTIEKPIDQLFPAAELRDGKNVFVARVDVQNKDHALRPGMRGDGIVYGPLRPWMWSFIHRGYERVLWWVGY